MLAGSIARDAKCSKYCTCSIHIFSYGALAHEGSVSLSLKGGMFHLQWDVLYGHCHVLMLPP